MRKTLLAVALMATGFTAHADYQCSVTPRDDVVLSPQTVQVKGENGNLVITPEGNVTYNGKQYNLTAAQREQAKDYQSELRTALPWINEGALTRVEKSRVALDKIITKEVGESSNMRTRLTKLQGVLGSLGGLQTSIQNEWKNQEDDFQQFGKDVCKRVVSLEDSRKALVGTLK